MDSKPGDCLSTFAPLGTKCSVVNGSQVHIHYFAHPATNVPLLTHLLPHWISGHFTHLFIETLELIVIFIFRKHSKSSREIRGGVRPRVAWVEHDGTHQFASAYFDIPNIYNQFWWKWAYRYAVMLQEINSGLITHSLTHLLTHSINTILTLHLLAHCNRKRASRPHHQRVILRIHVTIYNGNCRISAAHHGYSNPTKEMCSPVYSRVCIDRHSAWICNRRGYVSLHSLPIYSLIYHPTKGFMYSQPTPYSLGWRCTASTYWIF